MFDSFSEAYNNAQQNASDYSYSRTGPPIDYYFDEENPENSYLEINIFQFLTPSGDGSTNQQYEVNRWVIKSTNSE